LLGFLAHQAHPSPRSKHLHPKINSALSFGPKSHQEDECGQ
jgi:hypothetical protein